MKFTYTQVAVESMSGHLSDQILSSEELENRLSPIYDKLKLSPGRLELMTGIRERRIWPVGTLPSDLSAAAGRMALEKSRINKNDIGIIVHASVCRDQLEPATACRVHHLLGLPAHAMALDLSNACLGVLSAWIFVAQMIESGQIRAGLVVAGENATPLIEQTVQLLLKQNDLGEVTRKTLKKYFANFTLGSGAFASVLCHRDLSPHSPQLLGGSALCRSSANELCQGGGDLNALSMETDSEKLLLEGMELSKDTWARTKEVLHWTNETPAHVITHQVGHAHSSLLFQELGLDVRKDYSSFPLLGNTGSVALPLTLAQAGEKKIFCENDLVALLGIGSGLNSVMLGMKWGKQ